MKVSQATALITGVAGQDGSYLAEALLKRGYAVSGTIRPQTSREHIQPIEHDLTLLKGDVTDQEFIRGLVEKKFDYIYNLASTATVARPWDKPLEVANITGHTPHFFLEAIRTRSPQTRFFQASSAEMYGQVKESPQSEQTPFRPNNIYGIGKLFAHNLVEKYRTDQNVFAVSGILFNHESPRRSAEFVTRKITQTLGAILRGEKKELTIGNLNAKRDWSYAGDIVEAMVASLEYEKPDSYVMASGKVHTVREFIESSASTLGIHLTWEGEGEQEKGKDGKENIIVRVDPKFYRPVESHIRQGDIRKIQKQLNWKPRTSFFELVKIMTEADK